MRKSVVAIIAAVVVLGSSAVYAQHRYFHHPRLSEDRSAFVDARIAAVHAGLKLTPEQEKNWPAVESAVRDFAKQRIARAEARANERELRRAEREAGRDRRGPDQSMQNEPRDPVARLRDRADNMAATAAGLKRIADAADPLYKSLDDGQKRRLAVLTRMGGPHGRGWHGFRGGDFGQGRDRGPEKDPGADGPQRL